MLRYIRAFWCTSFKIAPVDGHDAQLVLSRISVGSINSNRTLA